MYNTLKAEIIRSLEHSDMLTLLRLRSILSQSAGGKKDRIAELIAACEDEELLELIWWILIKR